MPEQPNILFILTDQHRRDHLGCYGTRWGTSPNIDRLAAEGVTFTNAYTVCPICTPARASIQTGLYPCGHGMQNNLFQPGCVVHELADRPELLSRRLGEAGYTAGLTGKWHLGYGREAYADPWYRDHVVEGAVDVVAYPAFYRAGSSLPTDIGYEGDDFPGHGAGGHLYRQYQDYLFDAGLEHRLADEGNGCAEVVSPVESTIDHFLVDRAIHLIDDFAARGRPWFFMLNFWGPHGPAYVPTEFLEPCRELPVPPWPSFEEDQADKPSIHNAKRARRPWGRFQRQIRYSVAYSNYLDWEIGRLLEHLRRRGLYDESLVLFAADHGDSAGCHAGLSDKAFHMYQDTTAIPLVVRPPTGHGREGVREGRFVNTTDLYSTVLDAAELPRALHERHGRSVLPLVRGESPSDWPEEVVTECTGLAYLAYTQRMIRVGDWKYVFNCGDVDELYDLASDPHEMRNLANEPGQSDRLADMRQHLLLWLQGHGDRTANDFRRLRGL